MAWMCRIISKWCGPQATVERAWQASCASHLIPLWFKITRGPSFPGCWASLYKSSFGMSLFFANLALNHQLASSALGELASSQEFYQDLDEAGWLLGDGQVCAGSKGQIQQMFEAFCGRHASVPREAQDPLDGWPQFAGQIAGLQIVLACCSYRDLREDKIPLEVRSTELGCLLAQNLHPPWLRAARLRPPDNPAVARNLFSHKQAVLEELLSHQHQDCVIRAACYRQLCQQIIQQFLARPQNYSLDGLS